MHEVALKDIEKDIEEVLRKQFGSIGLDHVELKAGYDHDGDPAVFVTAILLTRNWRLSLAMTLTISLLIAIGLWMFARGVLPLQRQTLLAVLLVRARAERWAWALRPEPLRAGGAVARPFCSPWSRKTTPEVPAGLVLTPMRLP